MSKLFSIKKMHCDCWLSSSTELWLGLLKQKCYIRSEFEPMSPCTLNYGSRTAETNRCMTPLSLISSTLPF